MPRTRDPDARAARQRTGTHVKSFAYSMKTISDRGSSGGFNAGDIGALEARLLRVMLLAVLLATVISPVFAPWRVTAGLLLGGLLSLWNYHWMRSSIAAAFNLQATGKRPKLRVWRYVLRYLAIGATVFGAYKLNIASLPAMLVGLCSFVVALFAEASRQIYLILIHTEEAD